MLVVHHNMLIGRDFSGILEIVEAL